MSGGTGHRKVQAIPKSIGYARVSIIDKTLALQRDALKAAGCKRIFIDKGVSNTHAERPGLRKALAALKPGDTLIVWKLDRFGRSLVHLVQAVAELQARGVNFRSLSDPIDTTIAAGRQALAALVEFECSLKAERAKLAQHAAAQRGGKRRRRPKPSLA